MQISQKLLPYLCRRIVTIALPVATAGGHDGILQELTQAKTPVTLVAVSDPVTGKSEFRYRGNNTPPVIRVQPGTVLNVEYKNGLAAQPKEDCFGHPCMQMTNLHFHGLHVSPNAPQDDVLDMMASPGETLHYSVQVPPQQPPGLYWYHTHSHGESYVQDLDGMSGAIVVEGIERYAPQVRNMRERIIVLRDLILPKDGTDRESIMKKVAMQTTQCGTAPEKPERAFTVNGTLRPKIDIAPGERQFWRIVNASPDLYADLELDSGSFEIVALDGMPLAYHDPSIRTRSMSHVLVPPAGRVEAIVTGPSADSQVALRTRCFDTGPDGDSNPQWYWPISFRQSHQVSKHDLLSADHQFTQPFRRLHSNASKPASRNSLLTSLKTNRASI